jgi:hypothetical protein
MTKRVIIIAILLSAASLFINVPQPLRIICALLQLFFLPGLVLTLLIADGRISRSDRVILSIILSPILISLTVAAVSIVTGEIFISAKIVLTLCYLLFFTLSISGRGDRAMEGENGVPGAVYLISFLYAGLILISYAVNNYLLIRSDSWYHAAVVSEVLSRGIPPKEPLLADFSIRYMWFYHLFQAVWIRFSGLPLFSAMGGFNIVNAFIFPYLIARFTAYFTEKKYLIVFATLFAIAGLDSASWILWPVGLVRAFFGDVTGMAEIKRMIANVNVNGVEVIRFLKPGGTWQVNWNDKFLTITAFNYSLNLFLAYLIFMLRDVVLTRSRIKYGVILSIMILGTFLFHVVTGIVLLFVIIGSSILIFLGSRYIYKEKHSYSDSSIHFTSAIIVAPIAVYYFISLVASGGAGPEGGNLITNLTRRFLHIEFRSILTILFPLIILFFPARAAFKKLFSGTDRVSRTMIGWIACLLILSVFVNIGIVGEKKFIYFLFMVIGPPIYVQVVERTRAYTGARRGLLVTAIIILFAVPPVLTFRGFMMHVPKERVERRRFDISEEDKRFFEWVRENTSREAVIVENNTYHLSPVFAERRNFYSDYRVIRGLRYGGEKLDLYRDIQASLYGEEEISPAVIDSMRRVGRELYVAVWKEDIESSPWLAGRFDELSGWFSEVYSSERVSLYSLKEQDG